MSRRSLPREPMILKFDPKAAETDSGVAMVFRDEEASTCWLLIKPGHLTGPHFNEQCLKAAQSIRERKPQSPEELYQTIRQRFDWAMFTSQGYEECKPLFERLFAAVSGKRPLRYTVALPGSPEEQKIHLRDRKRGFWDGLYGRSQRGYSDQYARAFLKGARLRSRIQGTEDAVRYA